MGFKSKINSLSAELRKTTLRFSEERQAYMDAVRALRREKDSLLQEIQELYATIDRMAESTVPKLSITDATDKEKLN